MKWFNRLQIVIVLAGFVAAIVPGGRTAKADLIWAQRADMPTPRWDLSSAVVNGKIYAIGGVSNEPGSKLLSTVEEYDPATNTWTNKSDMPTARLGTSQSSAVVDGKIYTFGGLPAIYYTHSLVVEVYDLETDTWMPRADLPQPRSHHASIVYNGFIYLFGGIQRESRGGLNFTIREAVLMYDPLMDLWLKVSEMPTPRQVLTANEIDGKIYTIGGDLGDYPDWTLIDKVEQYIPVKDNQDNMSNYR